MRLVWLFSIHGSPVRYLKCSSLFLLDDNLQTVKSPTSPYFTHQKKTLTLTKYCSQWRRLLFGKREYLHLWYGQVKGTRGFSALYVRTPKQGLVQTRQMDLTTPGLSLMRNARKHILVFAHMFTSSKIQVFFRTPGITRSKILFYTFNYQ